MFRSTWGIQGFIFCQILSNRTLSIKLLLVNVIFFSEYKESFKVEINRKSRAFARVIERKTAKFEIFHKR